MKKIFGFDKVEETLKSNLLNNRLHHCNLLFGVRGIGKFSFAKNFSSLVLSGIANDNIASDVSIENTYNLIEKNSHPDFKVLNRSSFLENNENEKDLIGIKQARKIIEEIQLTPVLSKNKVTIIDAIDDMTRQAQNGLLKVIEEPNKNNYLFLICHNRSAVLETILSRSNVINIGVLDFTYWKNALLNILENNTEDLRDTDLADDEFDKLSVLSDNSIGFAVDILRNKSFNTLDMYTEIGNLFVDKDILEIQKFGEIYSSKELFQIFKVILEKFFVDLIRYISIGMENIFIKNNIDTYLLLSKKNKIEKIIKDYEDIVQLLKEDTIFTFSKEHLINIIFRNYL